MSSVNFSKRCKEATQAGLNAGLLKQLLPDAKSVGKNNLQCAGIHGGKGRSFNINTRTGEWLDHSTGEKGTDLVGLIAAREGIEQAKALKLLRGMVNDGSSASPRKSVAKRPKIKTKGSVSSTDEKIERKSLPPLPGSEVDWNNPTYVYKYDNEHGELQNAVLRWEKPGYKKAFGMSSGQDKDGRWIPSKKKDDDDDVPVIPYRLRRVIKAKRVFIVEGENKVDRLRAADVKLTATCLRGGSSVHWDEDNLAFLRGKIITIFPDNDQAGMRYAERTAQSLIGVAASVKIVELPVLPENGDIIDWLEKPKNTVKRLKSLVKKAPFYEVPPEEKLILPPEERRRPFQVNLADYSSLLDLNGFPVPYDWLIQGSFLRGEMGMIFAPPGTGKGFLSLQLGLALASAISPFGVWESTGKPARVLYISAEDSDIILRNRMYRIFQASSLTKAEKKKRLLIGLYVSRSKGV